MYLNYFITAFRRLVREKVYVCINVMSLALGITSFITISLYLHNELTYDQHFLKHERIYRITTSRGEEKSAYSQIGIGPLLTGNYPQLGDYVRFATSGIQQLRSGERQFIWDSIYLADENVFDIFDHEIVYGDPDSALVEPFSIAISESVAKSYFGDINPIGEILESPDFTFRVTLVFADLPQNTHLKYQALLPFSFRGTFEPDYEDSYLNRLWGVHLYTYLLTPPGFDPATFDQTYEAFYDDFMAERGRELDARLVSELQPLASTHYGESLLRDQQKGNSFYIYGFSLVAAFIILIAGINYVNLATARASSRAGEIGLRKIIGAKRRQLVAQFLSESLILAAAALLLGLIIVEIALVYTPIGLMTGGETIFQGLNDSLLLLWITLLALLLGIVSGLYPAFYLSSISSLAAMGKYQSSWKKGLSIRITLVLLQLMVSTGVIATVIAMAGQLDFIANKPLGFEKENRLLVQFQGSDSYQMIPRLEQALLVNPGVIDVIDTPLLPGTGNDSSGYGGEFETNDGYMRQDVADRVTVGLDYIAEMGIEIIQGRGFSETIATDETGSVMVNESLVRKMGWDEPLGKRIGRGEALRQVIGVVRDFHYSSLHNPIGPLVIWPDNDWGGNLIIVIQGENISATVRSIEETIKQFVPDHVFEPVFLDSVLERAYIQENRTIQLTGMFAGICIFISFMGIFGLTSYTTSLRNKEFSIRKVFGASSFQILTLLIRYLIPLVLIASLMASIVSLYFLGEWLEGFAYQAGYRLTPYLAATSIVLGIVIATICLQAKKISRSNPIDSIRYE